MKPRCSVGWVSVGSSRHHCHGHSRLHVALKVTAAEPPVCAGPGNQVQGSRERARGFSEPAARQAEHRTQGTEPPLRRGQALGSWVRSMMLPEATALPPGHFCPEGPDRSPASLHGRGCPQLGQRVRDSVIERRASNRWRHPERGFPVSHGRLPALGDLERVYGGAGVQRPFHCDCRLPPGIGPTCWSCSP